MEKRQVRAISVRLSSIAHATEDPRKVARAILNLCPKDFPQSIEARKVKGHYGNEITLLHLVVEGHAKAEQFLAHLWPKLSSLDKNTIYDAIESHLDETGNLHLRMDKQEAFSKRIFFQQTEPIKVEISFEARGQARSVIVDGVKRKLELLADSAET